MKQVRGEWNVTVDGVTNYHVALENNKVAINHEEPVKLGKFKSKGSMLGAYYEIPLGNQTAVLYLYNSKPVLTLNGIDCETGQPYQEPKMPGWAWVFVVLYVLNFFLILGGAVGGAVSAGFACISAGISSNTKMPTSQRVLFCVGIYVAVTAVSLALGVGISMLLNG